MGDCFSVMTVVQPPDEYAENVSNSAFTNAIAAHSLLFAAKLAVMCQLPERADKYHYYAKRVYVPFDATVGYHPEYDGYVIGMLLGQFCSDYSVLIFCGCAGIIFNRVHGQKSNFTKCQLKGSVKEPNKFHIYETEKITCKASDVAEYIKLCSSFTRDPHARCS